jgi:hypothetical protein
MNANEKLFDAIREALDFAGMKAEVHGLNWLGEDVRVATSALDQLEAQQHGGLTVDEVMGIYHEWDKQAMDGIIPMIPDLRARLTAKLQGK